jgi:hypothetical protein
MDRCKKVGRIGPKEAKLDTNSAYGEYIFSGKENLEVEATNSFVSMRANVGVFSGKYYYEVHLKTNGLMQIGWATL